jgi:hypothetical protein
LDIAAGAEESMYYERELKFHNFLHLPAELRLKIYHHYLCIERGAGKSPKRGHEEFQTMRTVVCGIGPQI